MVPPLLLLVLASPMAAAAGMNPAPPTASGGSGGLKLSVWKNSAMAGARAATCGTAITPDSCVYQHRAQEWRFSIAMCKPFAFYAHLTASRRLIHPLIMGPDTGRRAALRRHRAALRGVAGHQLVRCATKLNIDPRPFASTAQRSTGSCNQRTLWITSWIT